MPPTDRVTFEVVDLTVGELRTALDDFDAPPEMPIMVGGMAANPVREVIIDSSGLTLFD